jgi:diaminopimelate epimerase
MHGLGNDFVVLDGIRDKIDLTPAQLRSLADRRLGVGCDQILVVEKATRSDVDFRYRIFNADGGEVEQCGNGARCFVQFVRARGYTDSARIRVETAGGIIVPQIVAGDEVTVDMFRLRSRLDSFIEAHRRRCSASARRRRDRRHQCRVDGAIRRVQVADVDRARDYAGPQDRAPSAIPEQ